MATYLQGVTDYIPDYQPFQPDLNFYANLMQTKQTQYDTNWNQLNNLYGQLYGADLTHDQNIKKKDELLKQIDFNLKRVSGLDLSLEQNVNQAMQVFRPFYEDKYLIKDMAWTKNFRNTYGNAMALQNSSDDKQAAKYWGVGIRGLEHRRQMFKDATLDETLSMGDAQYTPKVEVIKEYMDFAKKYDIGMVTQTPEGMYMVRKKNGEQLLPGLQQIFWAQYANKPEIQAYYKEEAFVERMDFATQNAEKFGGNKIEAEKDYIKKKYDWLKNMSSSTDAKAKNELETAKNLKANLETDIKSGNVNPQQKSYYEQLDEFVGITSAVEKNTSDLNNKLNSNPSNVPANEHTDDILNNIELARLKVDAGYAAYKAGVQIDEAAGTYAYSNYEVEYKPDAVAIAKFREASADSRLQTSHRMKLAENAQAEQLKRVGKYEDEMVANGRAYRKPDGSIELNPQVGGYESIFQGGPQESGQSSGDKTGFDDLNQSVIDKTVLAKVGPGLNNMMTYINSQVNGDSGSLFTNQQLGQILNHFRPTDPDVDKMIQQGKNYPNQAKAKQIWSQIYNEYSKMTDKSPFIKNVFNSGSMYHLNSVLVNFNKRHSGNTLAQQYNTNQSTFDLETLARRHDAMEQIRVENTKKIETKFRENLTYNANKLKEQGYNISNKQLDNTVDLVMDEYVKSGYNWAAMRKNAPEIDKIISGTLGANFIKSTETNRDRSWYEYIPGIYAAEAAYDAITGNRKNVSASWINDILNKSYNELATDKDPNKSLQSFVQTSGVGVDENGNAVVSLSSPTQSIKVDIDYAGDFGYQAAQQAIEDALALPMGDDTKFKFAFGNNIPTNSSGDADYLNDGLDDNLARSLLQKLYSKMGDKSIGDFVLSTSRVAMEDSKLGSTTFGIPKAIVDDVVNSMAGDFTEQQLKQMKDKIIQNGVTAIAPHDFWSHKLWNSSVPTATEIVLRNKDIDFNSQQGGGGYMISKANGIPGQDYNANFKLRILNNDGTVDVLEKIMDPKTTGKTVDQIEKDMWQAISIQDQENLKTFRNFHKTGDNQAIEKAMLPENFGKAPNKSFWKY